MLKLKRYNESPSTGFVMVDKATGWKTHSWSFNSAAAAWLTEQLRRGKRYTIEQARNDVEQSTCAALMATPHWEQWIEVTSEFKVEDYRFDEFDRVNHSPSSKGTLFSVVFPFCQRDASMALKTMRWIAEITPPTDHELILSHDNATNKALVDSIQSSAAPTFKTIKNVSYPAPGSNTWPPTVAFKSAAQFMEKEGKPWLWMEFDCIPLKPHWLDSLQSVYWNCGKAFAGPVIPDLGHCNGTSIYPANTPKRIPRALALTRTAWDVTMKPEMIGDCANLFPLFYHAWGVHNGKLHPYLGSPPVFRPDGPFFKQIPSESVIYHRCKDGSLVDCLRSLRQLQPA